MQAAILSGGLGTRLRSVDATVPKPMIGVAGKPFLEHLVQMLLRRGLTDFVFLLSYKSDVIIDFLKELGTREKGLRIKWSVEPTPMGTGGALAHAGRMLGDMFFVINGDSYLDMDYLEMGERFGAGNADAMMTVYNNREDTNVLKNVEVGADGVIAAYEKGTGAAGLTHVDAGVLALRRKVLDLIPRGKVCSLENDIYPRLISARSFVTFPVENRFYDIGTPDRLREFEKVVRG